MNILLIGSGRDADRAARLISLMARPVVALVIAGPQPEPIPEPRLSDLAALIGSSLRDFTATEPVAVPHVFTSFMCELRPALPCPFLGGPASHRRKERDYG